jgi:hypothetical protein
MNASLRTFSDLQCFAAVANAYRRIRVERPLVPAALVKQFLDDPDICRNIDQYTCAHVWNMSAGEADECGGNIRCVNCDIDGDA